MFLIAGAIAGSPELVCGLAARYKEAGADAVAVCPPPFFRHGQPGIIRFMREVADRSVLPVYLYDIPAFTSPMSFDTIVELSSHRNICGLKDSSRDFARFEGLLSTIKPQRPEFRIYTGSEELLLVSLVMGADGATVAAMIAAFGSRRPLSWSEICALPTAFTLSYLRRTQREYVNIKKPRLSTVLSGTPNQIVNLMTSVENGLFSRFLFYYLDKKLEWIDVFDEGDGEPLDEYFEKLGQQYLAFYHTLQELSPIKFQMTKE